MKKLAIVFSLLTCISTWQINAQCSSSKYSHKQTRSHSGDLVDVAASNSDFSTLVTAVKTAELVNVLKGDGPFTIFAPSNTAFSKLPEGTVESLLTKNSRPTLTAILTYHVIPSEIKATTLVNAIQASGGSFIMETVNGETLTATLMNGNPVLIDANGNKSFINATDIDASNGVIHVIDAVVMPI